LHQLWILPADGARALTIFSACQQEKFRKLEEKEKKGGDDYRGKKIHVRSKDPGKIARQFEKGDRELDKPSGKGRKVRF
jgi:hypothetical protein